jgi:alpha-D-ribose 1-methylphosphonate 5-triphosphate synthase subunit PhnH
LEPGEQRTRNIRPGFTGAAEFQSTFRAVLGAMSRPGAILPAGGDLDPPEPIRPASGAVCLTLLDFETPLWTDLPPDGPAVDWLRFHCGAPRTAAPGDAAFVLITRVESLCPLDRFHPGEEERPERGATVLVQVEGMETGAGPILTGPGIENAASLRLDGMPPAFWRERAGMNGGFPLGLDFVFTANRRLAALPRSAHIEV